MLFLGSDEAKLLPLPKFCITDFNSSFVKKLCFASVFLLDIRRAGDRPGNYSLNGFVKQKQFLRRKVIISLACTPNGFGDPGL